MSVMVPPPTARIRFRQYVDHDADAVTEMFADPRARRFYPQMEQAGAAGRWIRWSRKNYQRFGFGLWVIEHRENGSFLGDCGLTYQLAEGHRLLELGYHLQADHRGYGYATEAGRACMSFAFDNLEVPLVCSIVDPDNTPSIGVASRLHSSQRTFKNDQDRTMLLFWSDRP